MRTQTGLIGRLALFAFFGSSIAVVSCGDDTEESTPSTGGAKAAGGAGGRGGSGGATGGTPTATGGKAATTGGNTGDAGSNNGPGGAGPTPEAGAGGTAGGATGDSGSPGSAGDDTGPGGGGAGGVPSSGGAAGEPELGGAGGEGGEVALGDVYQIYVGCSDTSGTIQSYTLERASNVLTPGPVYKAGSALSFGALNPDHDRLYVSHKSEGLITVFERDLESGALDERSSVDVPYDPDDGSAGAGGEGGGSSGLNPGTQAIAIDQNSQYLYAANFSASNVYVFELQGDGDVGDLVEDVSNGTNPQHVVVSTTNQFLLVPYTGSDQVAVYDNDESDGSLTLADPPVGLGAGTGPRHLAIHPSGDYVYSVNEEEGTITNFAFDDNDGAIDADETIDSPTGTFVGDANPSEIVLDPDGQFAYVANRLDGAVDGAISIFSISQNGVTAGRLTPLATNPVVSTRGASPRDIALTDDGNVLIAINQNSDSLAIFNVNTSGALGFVSTRAVCDQPYFVRVVTP